VTTIPKALGRSASRDHGKTVLLTSLRGLRLMPSFAVLTKTTLRASFLRC